MPPPLRPPAPGGASGNSWLPKGPDLGSPQAPEAPEGPLFVRGCLKPHHCMTWGHVIWVTPPPQQKGRTETQ